MENRIKQSYVAVVAQVVQAVAGVEQHQAALSLSLVSAEAMKTNLGQLTAGETKTKQAKAELRKRQLALKSAMLAARDFLFIGRDLLKTRLGKTYSSGWDEAGFRHSLEVPRKEEQVLSVLLALSAYFTRYTAHQNAPLNVTAAHAMTLRNALMAARTALNSQMT
ncbi:MAG: hypothetical protein ACK4UN_17760, partial [Limisphaerales bacterium]